MEQRLELLEKVEKPKPLITRARDLSLFKLVAAMSVSPENAPPIPGLGKIGVLLIEEGTSIAVATADGLRQCGFSVWSESSYVRGLELYHALSAEVDIVLLDVADDHFNARYAIHLIKRIDKEVNICVIADAFVQRQLEDLLDPRVACVLERPLPHINTIADRLWLLAASGNYRQAV